MHLFMSNKTSSLFKSITGNDIDKQEPISPEQEFKLQQDKARKSQEEEEQKDVERLANSIVLGSLNTAKEEGALE
jgi:hypothetical protein